MPTFPLALYAAAFVLAVAIITMIVVRALP
jgi:hypothetical protein